MKSAWIVLTQKLPIWLLQVVVWLLIHVLYRIRSDGLQHIPREGAVIIACNHVSFVDALLIGGLMSRAPRFVMYHKVYKLPVMNLLFRAARVIPIAPAKEDAALLEKAYAEIRAALDNGELVGIFPEGGLTPDGEIHPFKPGIEKILATNPVPVVPMALQNLWGSMWSKQDSRLRRARLPRRFRAEIALVASEAIPPDQVTAEFLEVQVRVLRGDAA
ncbi:MAG: 1-acyl-sn-glycerol-3-phosphate acyltransferase [Pseudomonadota bacterium]